MRVRRTTLYAAIAAAAVTYGDGTGTLAPHAIGLAPVAWLQGCWVDRSPERTVEERWSVSWGGAMVGTSRVVRDNRQVTSELLVLREQGDRLAYEAQPSGQPSATFLSQVVTGSRVIFENPDHDFPQRIGYERGRFGAVRAWVEGTTAQGENRRIEFAYQRILCVR